ncbi:transmembrane protein, putative [Medicago truncatula]|uniref:Mitochondrial pyruvate carrier n=1 Tax=Medicago truncatula TaxID=3880 RepID=G7L4A1_MEDTR|nr:transmembrane protein, putative [Medicago truncatula]
MVLIFYLYCKCSNNNRIVQVCVFYSGMFMRFAWVVKPCNIHLLVCHMSNETVQLYQLSRSIRSQRGVLEGVQIAQTSWASLKDGPQEWGFLMIDFGVRWGFLMYTVVIFTSECTAYIRHLIFIF